MSLPNFITIIRILLTPFFIILVIQQSYWKALLIFILAGITDALDGLLARWFGQKTEAGAYLDPIADKLLLASSFIALTVQGHLAPWITVVVLTRDVLIVIGVSLLAFTNVPFKIRPTILSKMTTLFQLLLILSTLLAKIYFSFTFGTEILVYVTAAFTIASGLQYIYHGIQVTGDSV